MGLGRPEAVIPCHWAVPGTHTVTGEPDEDQAPCLSLPSQKGLTASTLGLGHVGVRGAPPKGLGTMAGAGEVPWYIDSPIPEHPRLPQDADLLQQRGASQRLPGALPAAEAAGVGHRRQRQQGGAAARAGLGAQALVPFAHLPGETQHLRLPHRYGQERLFLLCLLWVQLCCVFLGALLAWGRWLEPGSPAPIRTLPPPAGPCFFLSCPIGIEDFRTWFIDLWNNSIIPYLQEGAKDGLKVPSACWHVGTQTRAQLGAGGTWGVLAQRPHGVERRFGVQVPPLLPPACRSMGKRRPGRTPWSGCGTPCPGHQHSKTSPSCTTCPRPPSDPTALSPPLRSAPSKTQRPAPWMQTPWYGRGVPGAGKGRGGAGGGRAAWS